MRVIQELARLYPRVRPLPFYKVFSPSGDLLDRDGCALSYTVRFSDFLEFGDSYRKRLLSVWQRPESAERIRAAIGRDLVLSDIRLAFKPVGTKLQVAFVDDVKQIDAHLLIETSPDNWQAHFVLSRECTFDEVLEVQRWLSNKHGADTAAHGADQPRRPPMAGLRAFLNNYAPLDPDSILDEQRQLKTSARKAAAKTTNSVDGGGLRWSADVLNEMWTRYYRRADEDCSRADQAFVVYLLSRGIDEDEVTDALKAVSKDIEKRKAGHLDDYCQRTIRNAVFES